MKKSLIISILALAAASVSATEIGFRVGAMGGDALQRNQMGLTTGGVTLGTKVGKFGAELAYDRSIMKATSVSEYSLTGSYPVLKFGKLDVLAKAGVSYIDPTNGVNGYALAGGVGVSFPVTKSISAVADYSYKLGQDRVNAYDGNVVTAGIKYSF